MSPRGLRRGQVNFRSKKSCSSLGAFPRVNAVCVWSSGFAAGAGTPRQDYPATRPGSPSALLGGVAWACCPTCKTANHGLPRNPACSTNRYRFPATPATAEEALHNCGQCGLQLPLRKVLIFLDHAPFATCPVQGSRTTRLGGRCASSSVNPAGRARTRLATVTTKPEKVPAGARHRRRRPYTSRPRLHFPRRRHGGGAVAILTAVVAVSQ